jgi:hypothetical protein
MFFRLSDETEDTWVNHVKRGVIELFHSKISGGTSDLEESMMGPHRSHYRTVKDKVGGLYIRRLWTQADYSKPKFNAQETTVKGEADIVIDTQGIIITMATSVDVLFGASSERNHKVFSRMKEKLKYEKGEHAPLKAKTNDTGLFTDTKSFASMTLKSITDYNGDIKELEQVFPGVKVGSGNAVLSDDLPQGITSHHLGLEKKMEKYMKSVRAKRLLHTVDFMALLLKLRRSAKQPDVQAQLSDFVHHHPRRSLAIMNAIFDRISSKLHQDTPSYVNTVDFLKVLQNLMIATQTKRGQMSLIRTLISPELVQSFLVSSITIQRPINETLSVIEGLKESGLDAVNKNPKYRTLRDESVEEDILKGQAYMIAADTVSRSKNTTFNVKIINQVLNNLQEAAQLGDATGMLMHIHALANMKHMAPLSLYRQLLKTNAIPTQLQLAIMDGLQHRVKRGSDDTQVTRLVHDIVRSKHLSPMVKSAAIQAQGMRHRRIGTAHHSMLEFAQHYHHAHKHVKKHIEEFFYDVGTVDAGKLLTKVIKLHKRGHAYKPYMAMSDAMFLGRVWRGIKRGVSDVARKVGRTAKDVGRTVGRVAKVVGKGVVTAAKGVATAAKKVGETVAKVALIGKKIKDAFEKIGKMFARASFKGPATCYPASTAANDKICLHDNEMINFVAQQGNLGNLKYAKHFEFEKLIGTEAVNLYAGAVGYAGIRAQCTGPDAQFSFAVFGRGAAKARLLGRNVPLISGHIDFSKPSPKDPIKNSIYLKVYETVLFNRNILPSELGNTGCVSKRTRLFEKTFPNLVRYSIYVVIVVVPCEFGFSVNAAFGADSELALCPTKFGAHAQLEPYFEVGVRAHAGISIVIASGGLDVGVKFSYRLIPQLEISQCNKLCARLKHQIEPCTIEVGGYLGFLGTVHRKNIFSWKSDPKEFTLTEKCFNIGGQIK